MLVIYVFSCIQYNKNDSEAVQTETGAPAGNISSVDWSSMKNVIAVDCVPLTLILHKAQIKHVNFFILDVEARSYFLEYTTGYNSDNIMVVVKYIVTDRF